MLLKWKNTNFTNIKEPISIDNIDDNEIEVCNKTFFSKNDFKNFIDYKNAKKIRPLCIFLSKISDMEEILKVCLSECMSFWIKDEQFL